MKKFYKQCHNNQKINKKELPLLRKNVLFNFNEIKIFLN